LPDKTVERLNSKRKRKAKLPISINFSVPQIDADVEMKDAKVQTKKIALPKELPRPAFCEVSKEALVAASPELAESECPPAELIRDILPQWGAEMLHSLAGVTASPPSDRLPDELSILVNEFAATDPPTHLMAVYGARPTPGKPIQVRLYPAYGLVFAANCAKLPLLTKPTVDSSNFPQSEERSSCSEHQLMARVQPLCLPSPETYPQLANYLYTKKTSIIFSDTFLPRASQSFNSSQHNPIQYASELARKYTGQALLQHISLVHGLWQNVCALGVFDESLWEAMDVVWRILLTALAIGTGNPSLMIPGSS